MIFLLTFPAADSPQEGMGFEPSVPGVPAVASNAQRAEGRPMGLLGMRNAHLATGSRLGHQSSRWTAALGVRVTQRWREVDSNHRYRSLEKVSRLLPERGCRTHTSRMGTSSTGRLARRRWLGAGSLSTSVALTSGPTVRIHLPAAEGAVAEEA
jgi:hypothetical protein